MAETAFQTQYRQEHIASFERRQSALRMGTVTEAVIKGNTAVFLVAGSGGATAVTRGVNGLIPGRADDLTQNSCTLAEWHDKPIKTGFNVFASQGDQRRIMQETTMAVLNRKIDALIITELETATNEVIASGSTVTASLQTVAHIKAILGNNNAGGGQLFGAITPAFHSYLIQVKEFGSVDYTNLKPFDRETNDETMDMFRWLGMTWIVHTGLTGVGTATETCLFWNRKAIGHAADKQNASVVVGYDDEDDYSFARCSMFMGAKMLQAAGVVKVYHDGSAFAAV